MSYGEPRTSLPRAARIVRLHDETPQVRTFVLDVEMEAAPGQFVMAWLPDVDEKPFSLVAARPVTLTIARVGPFTEALFELEAGDRLWVRGPLGTPFRLPELAAPGAVLLVGGGYGVAPLYFLAEVATAAGWDVDAVIGARTEDEVFFADRFRALGARLWITTEDGSLGEQGLATEAVAHLLDEGAYATLYGCGPEAMLAVLAGMAQGHGLPAELSYERYMRCGVGVCGTCSHLGWLVCRDGPVRHLEPQG
jgi:dihydroorotate dehydrogenase electron transfer subunit